MAQRHINEFDFFFLSLDEPNAEKHFGLLAEIAPWAERVAGVKGFDSAHRAAAMRSSTEWFVTVDADNIVRPTFLDLTVELDAERAPLQCYSWNAVNMINGLIYGNGGVKLWSKAFVLTMNSHENADDPRKAVDFCWEANYRQLPGVYSEVWSNGSPYQAFRAGFREGIKLALDRGARVEATRMTAALHPVNLRNLRIWCCVGADIEHGAWAMYGARLGLRRMCDPAWDHTAIRDYDWFAALWDRVRTDLRTADDLRAASARLGEEIEHYTKLKLPLLDADESDFFRETFKHRNE